MFTRLELGPLELELEPDDVLLTAERFYISFCYGTVFGCTVEIQIPNTLTKIFIQITC